VIVPDSPVPVEAYRVWGLARGGRLESPTTGFCGGTTVWTPYEAFRATCLAKSACDGAPNPTHTCGVHAYKTLGDALLWARKIGRVRPVVVGTVRLWGTVVETSAGWRAEYAYPHKIFDHDRLAAAYGLV
jgi:hypothetical protein